MAKEWILNQAMNRFQMNFKRNVGAVSELIRKCSPKTVNEWEEFYYKNAYPQSHLVELGRKLYTKITENIQQEIAEVTVEDCIAYIHDVVINRTFDGYQTEIKTVYGELQAKLGVEISSAPDEWDRGYNVDFYIKLGDKYIGLQIKPVTFEHFTEDYRWREMQDESHARFQKDFGGKVFIVFSGKVDGVKQIANPEIIPEIETEIARLSGFVG
jgi:hypothetical protein